MAPLAGLAALICVGIGVDFSGQTLAEQDLRDQASFCARQGADMITVGASAGTRAGRDSAYRCLSSLGLVGTITVEDNRLEVTSAGRYTTRFLSVIGINDLPTTAVASVSLAGGR